MSNIKNILNWAVKNNFEYHLKDNKFISKKINYPWNIWESNLNNISYIDNDWIDNNSGVVFTKKKPESFNNYLVIITDEPKYNFVKCVNSFFKPKKCKVVVGKNVNIGKNCSIGNDGFGYIKNKDGSWIKFPHFGNVIIGDDVDISNNVCIDRGSLSNTVIKNGVKIDNLVHIAHNVEIGENTLVIASSVIAGSSKIGKNCWISPKSVIKNGINIGDNVLVGLGSVVLKDVESGKVVVGNPAKELIKK